MKQLTLTTEQAAAAIVALINARPHVKRIVWPCRSAQGCEGHSVLSHDGRSDRYRCRRPDLFDNGGPMASQGRPLWVSAT
jgi:hypothetical protein